MDEMFEDSNEESGRKLASVQRVLKTQEVPGKDRIHLIRVLGYETLAPKTIQAGDLVVYHEVDSYVPVAHPAYAFLQRKAHSTGRAPIKIMRMGGVYSQGLALGLESFPELSGLEEGQDLTKVLDVEKYDRHIRRSGDPNRIKVLPENLRPWPDFAPPKTAEVRAQSYPWRYDDIVSGPFIATHKLDGCSMTVGRREDGEFFVCSRNYRVLHGDLMDIAVNLGLERVPAGMTFQGELCGPGIQGNREQFTEKRFFVYNGFHGGRRMDAMELNMRCLFLGLEQVPVVEVPLGVNLDEMLAHVDAMRGPHGGLVEGVVLRNLAQDLSVKVLSRAYEAQEDR